jgi:hypothetical protein
MSLDVKDAVGVTKTLKTTLNSGEHTPHHQIDGTVTVSGPLTNEQLRALAVPVALDSNSLTALENISVTFPSSQNVSVQNASLAVTDNGGSLTVDGTVDLGATSLSALENITVSVSGVSTAANQVTANNSLSNIDGKLPALSGGRLPVDIGGSGSITITSGTVTVSNEVEVKNDSSNPLPVSGTVSSNIADGSGNAITSSARGSQRALSVQIVDGSGNQVSTFGSSSVSVSNFPATQPVSGTVSVTDNGGSLTVDGSLTATQATAASLKAQAQLLNAAGSVVDYAMTGTAGTPATDVVSVQGVAGGTAIPVSLASVPSHPVTGTFWPATQPVSGSVSVSNFPATQPVSLASVPSHPVTGTFWQATQPVSLASAPVTPITDNNGSLTVDGTVTSRLADGAGNNLTSVARGSERALSVQIVDASGAQVTTFGGGGTVTATQTTPSALKAQAQILDATGSQMSFANAGIAGTPSVDVLTVQGSTSGTPLPVSIAQYPTGNSVNTSSFTSTSSSAFAGVDSNRKVLTVFNEGNGTLYIKPGSAVSITDYQIRMASGDYWEVPAAQVGLQHFGVFASTGTARITSIS